MGTFRQAGRQRGLAPCFPRFLLGTDPGDGDTDVPLRKQTTHVNKSIYNVLQLFLAASCWKHERLYNWECFISFFIRPLWDNIQVINLLETMWHTYGQFENMGCSAATWYLSVLQIYSCRSVQIYSRSTDPGLTDSSRTSNAVCGHNRDI